MYVGTSEPAEDEGLALVGGNLIDGTGKQPIANSAVLVAGTVIREVGEREGVRIPPEFEIIDISGKTIMPGMTDCHCHISITNMSIERRLFTPRTVEIFETAEMMRRTLHAGFTTVRDAGTLNDVGFRQAVEMGLVEGPRLILAGALVQTGGHFDTYYPSGVQLPFLGGGHGGEVCDGVPEVRKASRKVLRQGFDFIKVATSGGVGYPVSNPDHTEWSLDELRTIVYEASARGKGVMAHAISNRGIKNAILGGVWSVEHGTCLDDEAIEMLVGSSTYLVSTLSIVQGLSARRDGEGLAPVDQSEVERLRDSHFESFEKAVAAGVKIALGSDAIRTGMHGKNAYELDLVVQHGLTPMQAIVAATKTASEVCRVDQKVGTVEVGKLADLLVVDGNPLDDISILQDRSRFLMIIKQGRSYVDKVRR